MTAGLTIDFAGEVFTAKPGMTFGVGREGELALDDNPYLHRRFLEISHENDLWWVTNIGSRISAQMTDRHGLMRSSLAPGARLPVVFPVTIVTFSAGPTTYELELVTEIAAYEAVEHRAALNSQSTIAPGVFTLSQRQAIVALAEPVLRRAGNGSWTVPTAVEAAKRLRWTQTKFNRKLDNVCDKLSRAGVGGLRGAPGAGATNRRSRLVEYAVSTLLVTADDLYLLDVVEPDGDD